jgi:hypothetical protein
VYSSFKRLANRYAEQARFVVIPRALWEIPLYQVAALHLAAKSGKYTRCGTFVARRVSGGMNRTGVSVLCKELGIESSELEEVRKIVTNDRTRASKKRVSAHPHVFHR